MPCPESFTCEVERDRCVSQALPEYASRPVPGRGARVIATPQGALLAAIDPQRRQVLLGAQIERQRGAVGEASWWVLSESLRAGSHRLALAADARAAVVVWIGQQGFYHLAVRGALDEDGAWSTETIKIDRANETPSYAASDDFDVALDGRGEPLIAYRDRTTRALMTLQRGAEATWTRAVVDDGRAEQAIQGCPLAMQMQRRRGTGHHPDLLAGAEATMIAYHDADCGELRLATRRAQGPWRVRVLDRGARAPREDHVTGRYPSLAVRADGAMAIAYMDQSYGRLMYGALTPESFSSQVIDPGVTLGSGGQQIKAIVGAFAKLSFATDSSARVTYFDATSLDAMLATAPPQGDEEGALTWRARVLWGQGISGFFADHAVDADGALLTVAERLVVPEQGGRASSELLVDQRGDP